MTSKPSSLEHYRLSDPEGWSIWPWAVVRGTGFPSSWVLELASPDAAHAAERWTAAELSAQRARQAVLEQLSQRLQNAPAHEHRALVMALRKVRKDTMPSPSPVPLDEWQAARHALAEERARFDAIFAEGRRAARARLRELAAHPRLREAVSWQNHVACTFMLDRLARSSLDRDNAESRFAEIRAATYIQRYCVKNDTIGFFGPVCWARVSPSGEALMHRPGAQLMATRKVFIEDWVIAALCLVLDRHTELRPWLRPRRLPAVGLVGTSAYLLMPAPMSLSEVEAEILSLCDGRKRARDIAAEVLRRPRQELGGEADVFEIMHRLCKRGLATWRVETPMSMNGSALLRELLEGVEDEPLRRRVLAPLDAFESACHAVAAADGPDALIASLEALETNFCDATGQPARRNAGQMYAARTLVFLDGRRADEITLGPAILDRLAPVLSILMHAGRWFTSEVARSYRKTLTQLHEQLATQMNTAEVPLLRFWLAAQPLFPLDGKTTPEPMREVVAALRRRWHEVLAWSPPDEPGARYTSQEILPRAREAFRADAPGWSLARHHGPDIMIAAADADAVSRGEFQIILGEFHCAINTSIPSCLLAQHPHVDDMYRLWDKDFPYPCVLPGPPRERFPVRTNRELATAKDYRLEWAPDIAGPLGARPLAAGDMVTILEQGDLVVRSRDGALTFDIIEFFGQALSGISPYYFKLPAGDHHTPRITIDEVVVAREQWKVSPASADFCLADTPAERFLRAQAWRQANAVPRFCFMRTPLEEKPIYIDFHSPLYVDLMAHLCKKVAGDSPAHQITVSEMLPGHEQLWLVDAGGERHTAEIRLVAVDPAIPEAARHSITSDRMEA